MQKIRIVLVEHSPSEGYHYTVLTTQVNPSTTATFFGNSKQSVLTIQ